MITYNNINKYEKQKIFSGNIADVWLDLLFDGMWSEKPNLFEPMNYYIISDIRKSLPIIHKLLLVANKIDSLTAVKFSNIIIEANDKGCKSINITFITQNGQAQFFEATYFLANYSGLYLDKIIQYSQAKPNLILVDMSNPKTLVYKDKISGQIHKYPV